MHTIGRYGYCGCRNTGGIPTSKVNKRKNAKTPTEMFSEEFHSLLKKNMRDEAFDFLMAYPFPYEHQVKLCKLYLPEVTDL